MDQCKINNNNNDVTIEVNVSCPGIVSTWVSRKRPGGEFDVIAKSTEPPYSNASGRINEKKIGQARSIVGHQVAIDTVIRLDTVPNDVWRSIFTNLSIDFIIRGGSNEEETFQVTDVEKEKTTSGKTIRIYKIIEFIQD